MTPDEGDGPKGAIIVNTESDKGFFVLEWKSRKKWTIWKSFRSIDYKYILNVYKLFLAQLTFKK